MKYLFTRGGREALRHFCQDGALWAFDYDGTLAPIVRNPDRAVMDGESAELLQHLNRLMPLAIISGRSLGSLRRLLPFSPAYLVGNHGLERELSLGSLAGTNRATQACRAWKAALAPAVRDDAGLVLEDKGLSLSLHYREKRGNGSLPEKVVQTISRLAPAPRIVLGKKVINFMPPGGHHKGQALRDIMAKARVVWAVYLGDDVTDEDVFSLPSSQVLGIRVGFDPGSSARYYLRRQEEIWLLLRTVISCLEGGE